MYYFINNDFEQLAGREWLITNGLGGYADSTLAGSNSRRYHGLLVAARNPPTNRQVLVSKMEKTLFTDHPLLRKAGGNQWLRDTAYHQGTVWPFLLGEYWQAYLRVHNQSEAAKTRMYTELTTLKQHFYEHDCLFGILEIFDGLHPKDGRGTANQAWSVGALIKLLSDYPLRQ